MLVLVLVVVAVVVVVVVAVVVAVVVVVVCCLSCQLCLSWGLLFSSSLFSVLQLLLSAVIVALLIFVTVAVVDARARRLRSRAGPTRGVWCAAQTSAREVWGDPGGGSQGVPGRLRRGPEMPKSAFFVSRRLSAGSRGDYLNVCARAWVCVCVCVCVCACATS